MIRYAFNVDRDRNYNYNKVIFYAKKSMVSQEDLPQFIDDKGRIQT